MNQYNVHEAKTHLSALLERVRGGEEIVIALAGRPVARLVPLAPPSQPRELGIYQGQAFSMAADFDELPPDIQAAFEGEGG